MNDLSIAERPAESILILDLKGNIRIGEDSLHIHNTLRQALARGEKRILLNLADVSYIDSSGLGELVAGYATCQREGADLKLLHLTHRVRELMVITKLLIVFDVFDDESEAIKSFDNVESNNGPRPSEATTGKLKNTLLDI
jgi:anti-sigma B factor antagonist